MGKLLTFFSQKNEIWNESLIVRYFLFKGIKIEFVGIIIYKFIETTDAVVKQLLPKNDQNDSLNSITST